MKKPLVLVHEFVENIPNVLVDGVVYVSIPYATVVHKCCCGCGSEVVTPLSPTDWSLTFDGRSVTLTPSIGNWSFACESHYWIENSKVRWAPKWSRQRIQAGRTADSVSKDQYFSDEIQPAANAATGDIPTREADHTAGLWSRIKRRWF